MMSADGMNYAPIGKQAPVVAPGEFAIAAVGLDHGHIFGMCNGLTEAGASLKWAWDPDPQKLDRFVNIFPQAKRARSEEEVFSDPEVKLVAGACVTSERCALGVRAMDAGKDYFTDKAPLVSLKQLEDAKAAVARTGKKYAVYYSERIHVETAVFAGQLIDEGAIGKVVQVLCLGPHRLNAKSRPDWFFKKANYGGILCDIGSHNVEQLLYYTGAKDAQISFARTANFSHPDYPELDDFGEASFIMDNGASGYFRVDWFTPDGLQNWGDGRAVILGTEGFIEQRKYMNLGHHHGPSHLFLANGKQETHFNLAGKVGYPFFGQLVLDCINRTENAMTQEHAFKAAELSVKAQLQGDAQSGR
ncbi:MAG: Gfo/Idh/MocA family oxidoreductase [Clostridiales bacterium]|nr:Gfo/Idh/MocA family oxidoreductase [Clostridiales bacterium]